MLLPLGALEDRNVGLEPLVDLLSRGQLRSQLRHLFHFLLIDLDRGLMPLQHDYLFSGLGELVPEPLKDLGILAVDVLKLRLQLLDPFVFLAELVLKLHLMRLDLLIH